MRKLNLPIYKMRNITGQPILGQLIEFIAWQTINTGAGKLEQTFVLPAPV